LDTNAAALKNSVEQALIEAIQGYFSVCRQRVPSFVQQHFHYPGTWQTNKRALGLDLLRAPFNLFWAPLYLSIQLLAFLLRRLGLSQSGRYLKKIPSGLTTDIQTYLTNQTFTHLLGRGSQSNDADELFNSLRLAMATLSTNEEAPNGQASVNHVTIDAIIHDALEQYQITRTASADIGNSFFSTIVGGFAFQKFTPGGFAVGLAIAAWLAHIIAVDGFIFGEWIGGFYYYLFPPSPSLGLTITSIALVMTILAIFASFSGLVTDPIQSWVGLHQRRLINMLKQLEQDFIQQKTGGFRPKDQIVARILDAIDAAKAHVF